MSLFLTLSFTRCRSDILCLSLSLSQSLWLCLLLSLSLSLPVSLYLSLSIALDILCLCLCFCLYPCLSCSLSASLSFCLHLSLSLSPPLPLASCPAIVARLLSWFHAEPRALFTLCLSVCLFVFLSVCLSSNAHYSRCKLFLRLFRLLRFYASLSESED